MLSRRKDGAGGHTGSGRDKGILSGARPECERLLIDIQSSEFIEKRRRVDYTYSQQVRLSLRYSGSYYCRNACRSAYRARLCDAGKSFPDVFEASFVPQDQDNSYPFAVTG